MSNSRRNFVKKALGAGAILAAATTVSMANSGNKTFQVLLGLLLENLRKKKFCTKKLKNGKTFIKEVIN